MKLKLLIVTILILLIVVGCTKNYYNVQPKQEELATPDNYNDPTYCELDSDCVYQTNSCCGEVINKYNYRREYSGRPKCHTQCVPNNFWDIHCNNNQCDRNIDCSNCSKINEFMESIGCFQEEPSVTVTSACDKLSICNC